MSTEWKDAKRIRRGWLLAGEGGEEEREEEKGRGWIEGQPSARGDFSLRGGQNDAAPRVWHQVRSQTLSHQPALDCTDVLSLRQGCSSIKKSIPAAEKTGPPAVLGLSKAWMELQGDHPRKLDKVAPPNAPQSLRLKSRSESFGESHATLIHPSSRAIGKSWGTI